MRVLPLLLCLTACAELPALDGSVSPEALNAPYPALIPLDGLLADVSTSSPAQAAQAELEGRAARLRGAAIPGPGNGDLAARGQRLRARAESLRNVTL